MHAQIYAHCIHACTCMLRQGYNPLTDDRDNDEDYDGDDETSDSESVDTDDETSDSESGCTEKKKKQEKDRDVRGCRIKSALHKLSLLDLLQKTA